MNNRYQPAHIWAALLLGGGGFSDLLVEGTQQAESLLVNMNRLWEAVVRRLAEEAASLRWLTLPGHRGSVHRRARAGPRYQIVPTGRPTAAAP